MARRDDIADVTLELMIFSSPGALLQRRSPNYGMNCWSIHYTLPEEAPLHLEVVNGIIIVDLRAISDQL